jgi:FtsH-binding integral membrane protein
MGRGPLVVIVVLLIGSIDLSRTNDKVPPLSTAGPDTLVRFARIRELDPAFDRRSWLYGGVAAVAMGLATAGALAARSSPEGQRQVFSQAGVVGVVLGLAGFFFVVGSRGPIDPPVGALLVPSLTLFAIAAIGGTVSRSRSATPPHGDLSLKGVAIAALSCTAATVVLAYAYGGQQDASCDTPTVHTVWTGILGWGAIATAVAAFVLGLAGLAARRWIVALICVLVNPAALIYMVLSTGALC